MTAGGHEPTRTGKATARGLPSLHGKPHERTTAERTMKAGQDDAAVADLLTPRHRYAVHRTRGDEPIVGSTRRIARETITNDDARCVPVSPKR